MKWMALCAVLMICGCAAGQRYAECDKKYPPPPNTFFLRNGQGGDAISGLLGYMAAKANGEDETAYKQWQKNITECTNEKTAAQ